MLLNSNFSSPNFLKRSQKIEYIILHFTEMPFKEAFARLCNESREVSAHYLIKENGKIFQLVKDENIACHVGKSSWHEKGKLNQNSIGIELSNLRNKEFTKNQMNLCIELCKDLTQNTIFQKKFYWLVGCSARKKNRSGNIP